ncbi:MAG: hypothetical protein RLZZ29_387 [Cyanobacteriota bacterium]|uniref:Uncharacterized protein n=1 Tax=Sphaerospermopsis reniformis TaxID=531300 RepID=A0A480A652_9CYAN|nr:MULTISPECIES: hypothetical protein [Sphaerospermopsis]MBC5797078.1 hypothetical protein [Sphaerospermopsis sp. LEGE 00249]MBD2133533.1 hypothetical protein [Sphaerospermopsis sp. FACHB-1094]MBD2143760.1 hypothetical protein [Sphaerospermopsis sp. FACHB-1194]GCL39153.1 hypothetical protein SR1949_42760 [Sphaerospermopsis reniformis]
MNNNLILTQLKAGFISDITLNKTSYFSILDVNQQSGGRSSGVQELEE